MTSAVTPVADGTAYGILLNGQVYGLDMLFDATGADAMGLVTASPAAYTLLGRLAAIATALGTPVLPAGAATAAGQATAAASLATVAVGTKAVTTFTAMTVGTTYAAGSGIAVNCTAAGNIVLQAADGSSITVPVNPGYSQFGFAIVKVVSQTATCTFTNLS